MVTEALLKKIDKYIEENLARAQQEEMLCYECVEIDGPLPLKTSNETGMPFNIKPEESWSDSLFHIIKDKDLDEVEVYTEACVDRKLFSKIRRNSNYSPSRETAISLCLAMHLNLHETEELLEKAGIVLSKSSPSDLVVRYYLENVKNYIIDEIDDVLKERNLKRFLRID